MADAQTVLFPDIKPESRPAVAAEYLDAVLVLFAALGKLESPITINLGFEPSDELDENTLMEVFRQRGWGATFEKGGWWHNNAGSGLMEPATFYVTFTDAKVQVPDINVAIRAYLRAEILKNKVLVNRVNFGFGKELRSDLERADMSMSRIAKICFEAGWWVTVYADRQRRVEGGYLEGVGLPDEVACTFILEPRNNDAPVVWPHEYTARAAAGVECTLTEARLRRAEAFMVLARAYSLDKAVFEHYNCVFNNDLQGKTDYVMGLLERGWRVQLVRHRGEQTSGTLVATVPPHWGYPERPPKDESLARYIFASMVENRMKSYERDRMRLGIPVRVVQDYDKVRLERAIAEAGWSVSHTQDGYGLRYDGYAENDNALVDFDIFTPG